MCAGVGRDAKLLGREVICEACDGHFKLFKNEMILRRARRAYRQAV
jgi:hypothetical protein